MSLPGSSLCLRAIRSCAHDSGGQGVSGTVLGARGEWQADGACNEGWFAVLGCFGVGEAREPRLAKAGAFSSKCLRV